MEALKVAQKTIETLKENQELAKYFEKDIEWFLEKTRQMKENYLRVGMIGITSSGKSTLINALLGEDILPTAVRPTSGIIITCSKGPVKQAVIYYNKRPEKDVIKGGEIKKIIQELGDEKHNPKNVNNVGLIEIKSPDFPFDDNVQIVDSPGLGAADMAHHERLTMESLLPSLDICIYLTTMKANSDQEVKENLAGILKHEGIKVLVAQNMLDSVYPKIGKNGIVEKDKMQVAKEHQLRLERILKSLGQLQRNNINVVQISAKQALSGKTDKNNTLLDESQLNNLIRITKYLIDRTLPDLEEKNKKAMVKYFDDMIHKEKTELKKQQGSLSVFSRDVILPSANSIQDNLNKMRKDSKSELDKITSFYKQTFDKIHKMDGEQIEEANKVCNDAVNRSKETNKIIIGNYQTFLSKTSSILEQMNLDPRNYLRGTLPLRQVENISARVPVRTEIKTLWKEKEGFANKVKRVFGNLLGRDWGWESYQVPYNLIDKKKVLERLGKIIDDQKKAITSFLEKVDIQAKQADKMLRHEIDRRNEDNILKGKISVEIGQRKRMIAVLQELLMQLDTDGFKRHRKYPVVQGLQQQGRHFGAHQWQKQNTLPILTTHKQMALKEQAHITQPGKRSGLKLAPCILDMINLAHRIKTKQFNIIFAKCQELSSICAGELFHSTLLWGWDNNDLAVSYSRFLGGELTDIQENDLITRGYTKGIHDYKPFYLFNENNFRKEEEIGVLFPKGPLNIYLQVNAIQVGASQKHISTSLVNKILAARKNCSLNWISQSIAEFFEADNLDEWVEAMFTLRRVLQGKLPGIILVNDKNPIYSLLMLELYLNKEAHIGIEVKLNNSLQKLLPYWTSEKVLKNCSTIVKSYYRQKQY